MIFSLCFRLPLFGTQPEGYLCSKSVRWKAGNMVPTRMFFGILYLHFVSKWLQEMHIKSYCSKWRRFFRALESLSALTIQIGLGVKLVMPIQEMQTDLFFQNFCNLILLISQPPNCRLDVFHLEQFHRMLRYK